MIGLRQTLHSGASSRALSPMWHPNFSIPWAGSSCLPIWTLRVGQVRELRHDDRGPLSHRQQIPTQTQHNRYTRRGLNPAAVETLAQKIGNCQGAAAAQVSAKEQCTVDVTRDPGRLDRPECVTASKPRLSRPGPLVGGSEKRSWECPESPLTNTHR